MAQMIHKCITMGNHTNGEASLIIVTKIYLPCTQVTSMHYTFCLHLLRPTSVWTAVIYFPTCPWPYINSNQSHVSQTFNITLSKFKESKISLIIKRSRLMISIFISLYLISTEICSLAQMNIGIKDDNPIFPCFLYATRVPSENICVLAF